VTEPDRAASGPFPMREHQGVPQGLLAYAQPTNPDGTFEHDRAGNPKVRRVRVRADPPTAPQRPDELLSDTDWLWATSAPRRWTSVTRRFAEHAAGIAHALTVSGCVDLEHDYRNGSIVQPSRAWIPHPSLADQHASARAIRRTERSDLTQRATALINELAEEWPGASAALANASDAHLIWLIRAGQDLLAGRSHDGARAFAQAHTGDTKARDDLPRLLTDAGFEPDALNLLGISRNPYIGLGGPILAHLAGSTLNFTGWPGPHDLRLPADHEITVSTTAGTSTLLVIENRQAAESICDRHRDIAVIWCHGQPPDRVLALISQAAAQVQHTVICTDADLGGIRIAARIYDHLPEHTTSTVIDVGSGEHVRGPDFSPATRHLIEPAAQRDDGVGTFARACLARGYAVEQESSTRAAIRDIARAQNWLAIARD
jgi:hypothetical protein